MAEERLIDDDKDRKYKIVKNADGEDELVIDGAPDEAESADEVGFEVPELDSDDEEAAIMTPEQLAARERMREEAEAARRKRETQSFAPDCRARIFPFRRKEVRRRGLRACGSGRIERRRGNLRVEAESAHARFYRFFKCGRGLGGCGRR